MGGSMKLSYTVSRGCEVYEWPLGNDAVIPIEYEVQRAEPAQMYGDAPHPGCPEEISPIAAYLNGEWLDFADVFGQGSQADYIMQLIIDARTES
jgi:hypothetical protein